jgi:hypothetical protein
MHHLLLFSALAASRNRSSRLEIHVHIACMDSADAYLVHPSPVCVPLADICPLLAACCWQVSVLLWPDGHIAHFPRGTTAGEVLRRLGSISVQGAAVGGGGQGAAERQPWEVVNVNNRLVEEGTPLQDGDVLVLSRELLQL